MEMRLLMMGGASRGGIVQVQVVETALGRGGVGW